jgi:hypothetical protein
VIDAIHSVITTEHAWAARLRYYEQDEGADMED